MEMEMAMEMAMDIESYGLPPWDILRQNSRARRHKLHKASDSLARLKIALLT